MAPEDNPAEERQPTEEEWEAFEREWRPDGMVRFNFYLPPHLVEVLEKLRVMTKAESIEDVIRKLLAHYLEKGEAGT